MAQKRTSNANVSAAAELGVQFNQLGQAWRREVDEELQSFGMTDATWRPLFHLGRLGDGIRQKDLAQALGIEGPSLVRLLDNLEAQKLVERHESRNDRRSKELRMTEAGRALLWRVQQVADSVAADLVKDVNEADLDSCFRVLEQIEHALQIRGMSKKASSKVPQ